MAGIAVSTGFIVMVVVVGGALVIGMLPVFLSMLDPLPTKARDFLNFGLKRSGIASRVPVECVNEIAANYAHQVETHANSAGLKRGSRDMELLQCIKGAAEFIRGWVVEGRDYPTGSVALLVDNERAAVVGTGMLPSILRSHGVALGSGITSS